MEPIDLQNNVSIHESEGQQNLLEYIRCDLCGGEDQTLLLVRYRNDRILDVLEVGEVSKYATKIIRLVNKVSSLINRGEVLLVATRKIV